MKLTHILSLATALLVLASPAAFAAKPKGEVDPARKAARAAARDAKQFDKNEDSSISGEESAALRKAFDADKTGPLKALDLNTDGTLDDNEIAAVKIGKGGKGAKKKKNAV